MVDEDWFDDPQAQDWAQDVRENLIPKLQASQVTVGLVPAGSPGDVKFAVELGLSIMMDKPIIAVVQPGTEVPEHLIRVADAIVEYDHDDPQGLSDRLLEVVMRLRRTGRL